MRLSLSAAVLSLAALFSSTAGAVTTSAIGPSPYPLYGSETRVTLQGTCHLVGEPVLMTLANGDVKDTVAFTTVRITNREVLEAMVEDDLINTIKGYSIVMVAHGHVASEVRFFAAHKTNAPVEIPLALLNLQTLDGPTKGTAGAGEGPGKLSLETRNFAQLVQGDFVGATVLVQRWTSKAVNIGSRAYPNFEYAELVTATGTFQGTLAAGAGTGALTLRLSGAKPVALDRYDMAFTPRADAAGPMSSPVPPWGVFAETWDDTLPGDDDV